MICYDTAVIIKGVINNLHYLPFSVPLAPWPCCAYLRRAQKDVLMSKTYKAQSRTGFLCGCARYVASLTSRFRSDRQHPKDTLGLVAFVDALVLHLLNVRQRVEGAAEVGFPCLWVGNLAVYIFPCKRHFH